MWDDATAVSAIDPAARRGSPWFNRTRPNGHAASVGHSEGGQQGMGHLSISRDASKALLVLCEHPTAPLNSNFLGADTSGTEPGVWCQDQVGSGTMTIAPHGHSDTQIPHPLQ